jgi:hypothetical protein
MTDQQLDLSRQGDQVFAALACEFPAARKWRLMFEQRLEPRRFEAIRVALLGYIAAVTETDAVLAEEEAMKLLLERRAQLVNYTRGGMLAPTREHTVAWNALHRSLVRALAPYAMAEHIDGIDLPVNVRLVYGDVDPAREQAPFSSTKLHSDVWAGIPADAAVVVLPVLGDIDDITIECFEMSRADEQAAMRALRDYDEGKHVQPVAAYSDCSMKHGHLYVCDARLMHRTVRKKRAGVRLSLDFRFRYNDASYRAGSPAIARGGPDSVDTRVPFATWTGVGSESLIVFADSMDDLRRKKDATSSPVNTARYRLVALADHAQAKGT